MDESTLRRFAAKVEADDNGCWIWTAARNPGNGYGRFYGAKADPSHPSTVAHRVAYEHYTGPIPDGMEIDHVCRIRACVNPAHLEPVSRLENVHRANAALSLDRCKNNHALTPDNAYYPNSNTGRPKCRECNREAVRAYQDRQRNGR